MYAPSGYWFCMARVVVVATSSVDPSVLAGHLEADDELFVVAPAVEQSRLAWLTNDEGDARDQAQAVGESIAADAPPAAPLSMSSPMLLARRCSTRSRNIVRIGSSSQCAKAKTRPGSRTRSSTEYPADRRRTGDAHRDLTLARRGRSGSLSRIVTPELRKSLQIGLSPRSSVDRAAVS